MLFKDFEPLIKNNDVLEQLLICTSPQDNHKYIVLANDDYVNLGLEFKSELTPQVVQVIQFKPRYAKLKKDQLRRRRYKSEVFTSLGVINEQIDCLENYTIKKPSSEKYGLYKTIDEYLQDTTIEITCGEAPYIVQRYNPVNGEQVDVDKRYGVLDRKLKFIIENFKTLDEFKEKSLLAYQSVYGYELQGDSLFIARLNLLKTYIEYLDFYYKTKPSMDELKKLAKVIAGNFIQMDGMTMNTPLEEPCIFYDYRNGQYTEFTVNDWRVGKAYLKCVSQAKQRELKKKYYLS